MINLFIAFLPAAFVGLFTAHYIQQLLFSPIPVAIAFIVGALIILWVEKRVKKYPELIHLAEINQISRLDALKVGCMQVFALIPGTSRSCATIIGAMFLGWSRRLATEFSFFLAIPTIFAASLYSLYKDRALFHIIDWPVFIVGLITAFISAFICIRWLLRYVSTHSFTPFAWYRIVFGVALLAVSFNGRFVEF